MPDKFKAALQALVDDVYKDTKQPSLAFTESLT
jgi:hypothetical protein